MMLLLLVGLMACAPEVAVPDDHPIMRRVHMDAYVFHHVPVADGAPRMYLLARAASERVHDHNGDGPILEGAFYRIDEDGDVSVAYLRQDQDWVSAALPLLDIGRRDYWSYFRYVGLELRRNAGPALDELDWHAVLTDHDPFVTVFGRDDAVDVLKQMGAYCDGGALPDVSDVRFEAVYPASTPVAITATPDEHCECAYTYMAFSAFREKVIVGVDQYEWSLVYEWNPDCRAYLRADDCDAPCPFGAAAASAIADRYAPQ